MRHNPMTVALTVFGIALAINIVRSEDTRRIVVDSACQQDAASQECQRVRADGAREQTIHTACITTRLAGLGCPAARRSVAQHDNAGGGNQTSEPSAPQIDAPGDGGSDNGGSTSAPPVVDTPPTTPPPDKPGLVDPVTDNVPGLDCHLSVLNVQLCN